MPLRPLATTSLTSPEQGSEARSSQICPPAQHHLCCVLPPERQDLALHAQLAALQLFLSLPPSAAGCIPASPCPFCPGQCLHFRAFLLLCAGGSAQPV